MIQSIKIIQPGETPYNYLMNPEELTGPWGETAHEAIAQYEADTGFRVVESWLRGDSLWIVSDDHVMWDAILG